MKKNHLIITILGLLISMSLPAQIERLGSTALRSISKINSNEHDEAVPFITMDGKRIYFTRTNDEPGSILKNKALHEIWYATLESDSLVQVEKAPKPLNAGLNSAVIGFDQTGTTLYLFGTYNKLFEDQKGVSFSNLKDDTWSKPQKVKVPQLYIEGGFYGLYMHPSEEVLMISKGKTGDEDLFVSLKQENGKWSEPVNLGATINTSSFEISPFISPDLQHLFFSRGSKTEDTDIFVSKRMDDSWTNWSEPVRLLAPINSEGFDAYFSMLPDSTIAFSSNRSGSSDIYLARLTVQPRAETAKPRPVTISHENRQQVIPLSRIESSGGCDGYVFFDFNKSTLRSDQTRGLDHVVEHLLTNQHLKVELGGHTDYIDTETFNEKLSENRASAVASYLISKGVSQERITMVGFGELYPVSNNEHNYGRSLNRRVEITYVDNSE